MKLIEVDSKATLEDFSIELSIAAHFSIVI
jgi:hypothetical protein